MHLTYQFSTIFSSYSFINPKFPNFNQTSHKFKTFFSYQSPNSLHDANPATQIQKSHLYPKPLNPKLNQKTLSTTYPTQKLQFLLLDTYQTRLNRKLVLLSTTWCLSCLEKLRILKKQRTCLMKCFKEVSSRIPLHFQI
ncbi:hypothetical protein P8452_16150 [Trifolium repens]|nr:hypothetical protein P8452_16150 [Trifolium repens]